MTSNLGKSIFTITNQDNRFRNNNKNNILELNWSKATERRTWFNDRLLEFPPKKLVREKVIELTIPSRKPKIFKVKQYSFQLFQSFCFY